MDTITKEATKITTEIIIEIEVITSVAISQGIIIDHTTALILDGKSFLKNSGEF